ncbi:CHAT domain-containing protein [Erythrobacter dokdonensis]|uniref:TPR repeat-containing protein n=1 Tax=Erythrobacter dokdonensis DSW-74 TaxID=1300349 RepID=A0A1A7BF38_9SPHN|nr:CHAT domain-containing protein [Erythrobacter dokdonensis]OBV10017.1 TPR repeat-containing protein [Erythrobacter dokdonensis DSW-74]
MALRFFAAVGGAVGALVFGLLPAAPGAAQAVAVGERTSLSLRDTFPIGSNGLCEAQILAPEPGAALFDRRYSVICRDAAAPVGTLWVVRGPAQEMSAARFAGEGTRCEAADRGASGATDLPGTERLVCAASGSMIRTDLLLAREGQRTYAASGLSAYATALELGLASLMQDKIVEGTVEIPLTSATDDIAFARQQAEAIAADQALIEAYRRSNAGNFAEAAEFFEVSSAALAGPGAVEARLNQGLQQSNLGNFAEARRLFASSRSESAASPVLARLLRNYEAMDALNQRKPEAALSLLEAPLVSDFGELENLRALRIGPALAGQLASENDRVTGAYSLSLTPLERAQLLDGQHAYLKATSLRLLGRTAESTALLEQAEATLASVRDGRVVSIVWLRAQVLGELAEVAERSGRPGDAESLHLRAVALLDATYPDSPAFDSARALLAGFYSRTGRRAEALGLYRDIITDAEGRPLPSLRGLLAPYFILVMEDGASGPDAAAELFAASQLLQRPGLAQTQAVLARELSGGSDEAAQLFRTTTNLSRGIEQLRLALIELRSAEQYGVNRAAAIAEREQRLAQLQQQQAEVLQKLATYPRYRAVSGGGLALADLQAILREGEAYVKLVTLDQEAYLLYVTADDARAWRADATPAELEKLVGQIRESIAVVEGGQVLTYPFEIERARELYVRLFAPVADRLPQLEHIVFEPDGPLLKLPINLLVTDDASVAAYKARLAGRDADEYDFRGTAWLGRSTQISTSVGAAAFRDVRAARPSDGKRAYLGLGENEPIGAGSGVSGRTRSALEGADNCQWSPNIWANPIKADELREAASRFGAASRVLTREEFTDSAILGLDDLGEYRILHFATHGLVTAPQPQCPPRPALLTSFDKNEDSDGLLSFAEIFGLRIDADLVILSACDTAGSATVGATREAGVTSGGEFALDGLVRAFVGAGGRTVLASHWPVPDDFDATGRLISGLFAGDGRPTAGALRQSQLALMDDADTSHPFYWSAFAVVGDGAIRLAR